MHFESATQCNVLCSMQLAEAEYSSHEPLPMDRPANKPLLASAIPNNARDTYMSLHCWQLAPYGCERIFSPRCKI